MSKEAMQLALEALETERNNYQDWDEEDGAPEYIHEAITALQEALAEQPAPVHNLRWLELLRKNKTATDEVIGAFLRGHAEYLTGEAFVLAAPQPAQQEPIYQYQMANGSWIDQTKESHDYNVRHGQATVRVVYTSPQPAQRKPLPCNKEDMKDLDVNQRLAFKLGWKAAEEAHNIKENT